MFRVFFVIVEDQIQIQSALLLSHSQSPRSFGDRVSVCKLGWLLTCDPSISASRVLLEQACAVMATSSGSLVGGDLSLPTKTR